MRNSVSKEDVLKQMHVKTKEEILSMYSKYSPKNIEDLVRKLSGEKSDFEKTKDSLLSNNTQRKDLLEENQNIGDLKKYLLQINNIKVDFKPKK